MGAKDLKRRPEPGDRRGPMVLMSVEYPSGEQRWESWANVLGRSRYFKVPGPRRYVTLDQLERVLAMSEPEEIAWQRITWIRFLPGCLNED